MSSIILPLLLITAFSGIQTDGGNASPLMAGRSASVTQEGGSSSPPPSIVIKDGKKKKKKKKRKLLKIVGSLVRYEATSLTVKVKPKVERKVALTNDTRFRIIPRPYRVDSNYLEVLAHNDAKGMIIADEVAFISDNPQIARAGGTLNSILGIVVDSAADMAQKIKGTGVVLSRGLDTFILRDERGMEAVIRLTDSTDVEIKRNFLASRPSFGQTGIQRGLNVEVEGRPNISGQLIADKIKFRSTTSKVMPLSLYSSARQFENRVSYVSRQDKEDAQTRSGKIYNSAIASKGMVKTAQENPFAYAANFSDRRWLTAALGNYEPRDGVSINFAAGSNVLSPEAKTQLDLLAAKIASNESCLIAVKGDTNAANSSDNANPLTKRRTSRVISYLINNYNIPLRRIVTPLNFSEPQAAENNLSWEGREPFSNVEVRLLFDRTATPQRAPSRATAASEP
jgi:outer membrane protein OmpA-like peptidoglycan-associated protein